MWGQTCYRKAAITLKPEIPKIVEAEIERSYIMAIIVKGPLLSKSSVCEPILRSLPEWFGIEQSNIQYIKDVEVLPTFLAFMAATPVLSTLRTVTVSHLIREISRRRECADSPPA